MKSKTHIALAIIKGLALIALGILVVIKPMETVTVLTLYFGVALVVRGTYLLITGFKLKKGNNRKSWIVLNGIMDAVFGLILLIHPEISLNILSFIIGFWAIMSGLLESAIATTRNFKKSWPQFLFGNAIFIFGWLVLLHPYISGIILSDLFGGLLIFMGLGYILLSIAFNRFFNI